jgi:hypothetical protein
VKSIKASYLWCHPNIKEYIIPKLIQSYFNIKIEWSDPHKCDLLFLGNFKKYKKFKNYFTNLFSNSFFEKKILECERKIFFRKNKPINIFYNVENERINHDIYDYAIGSDFNYSGNDNYLRIPTWKNYIDWSHLDLKMSSINSLNAKRFGQHYKLEEMLKPQGDFFLNKKKEICCFFSHILEPRKSFIKIFQKHFNLMCYGKFFDNSIKNHNDSGFEKIKILQNYFANFCPENEMYPGWYTEKIPDAFLGKTLPITWCDQNVKNDFNEKSFINLNNYKIEEIGNLIDELNSLEFIKKFTKEPLLIKNLSLDTEINFTKKILKNFI